MAKKESCASHPVSIFMAGDVEVARQICREYCDEVGFCVTVTATTYVYTGGQEDGFIVGLINYPRFPKLPHEIDAHAIRLGATLREKLGQESFSIQYPEHTIWHSWRGEE